MLSYQIIDSTEDRTETAESLGQFAAAVHGPEKGGVAKSAQAKKKLLGSSEAL